MLPELLKLVLDAKSLILEHLKYENPCSCRALMLATLNIMSIRERLDGTITRVRLPIDRLAFIIAYKRLEEEGEITIQRGSVPFPMTDFNSVFSLKRGGLVT